MPYGNSARRLVGSIELDGRPSENLSGLSAPNGCKATGATRLEELIVLGTTASRYLSLGTTFDTGLNFGNVIGGAIGQIGVARTGRVM